MAHVIPGALTGPSQPSVDGHGDWRANLSADFDLHRYSVSRRNLGNDGVDLVEADLSGSKSAIRYACSLPPIRKVTGFTVVASTEEGSGRAVRHGWDPLPLTRCSRLRRSRLRSPVSLDALM